MIARSSLCIGLTLPAICIYFWTRSLCEICQSFKCIISCCINTIFRGESCTLIQASLSLSNNHFILRSTSRTNYFLLGAMRSRVEITFELNRYLLSVFFQSYFPAIATVVLAGFGMWLDPKSVPARIALGKLC